MSILTKQEREEIRHKYQAESIADASVIRTLLDTIDALEADRDIAQETIDSCFEILEDMGFSTADPDGCGLPGIVCDMAGALNALSGGLK